MRPHAARRRHCLAGNARSRARLVSGGRPAWPGQSRGKSFRALNREAKGTVRSETCLFTRLERRKAPVPPGDAPRIACCTAQVNRKTRPTSKSPHPGPLRRAGSAPSARRGKGLKFSRAQTVGPLILSFSPCRRHVFDMTRRRDPKATPARDPQHLAPQNPLNMLPNKLPPPKGKKLEPARLTASARASLRFSRFFGIRCALPSRPSWIFCSWP